MIAGDARALAETLGAIFMPNAAARQGTLRKNGTRLVHYTSAEAAVKIISGQQLWLRNARAMHDFSEIAHGHQQLVRYFRPEARKLHALRAACDACKPGACDTAIRWYDAWWPNIQNETFVGCFSEHDATEDLHGRLSMWRTFSRNAVGVALVLTPPQGIADGLNAFLVPVSYFSEEDLDRELDAIVENINDNSSALRDTSGDQFERSLYWSLVLLTVSMKHPGFHEEREWRLVYLPHQIPSSQIEAATETLGGVPQIVQKLSLKNDPDRNVRGMEIRELLDRIIVGPTDYSYPVATALIRELGKCGVEDAQQRVFTSGIPIR